MEPKLKEQNEFKFKLRLTFASWRAYQTFRFLAIWSFAHAMQRK